MKAPKHIIEKAQKYEHLKKQLHEIGRDLCDWINDHGEEGVSIENIFTTTEPTGDKQMSDGEYCDQASIGEFGDSFS